MMSPSGLRRADGPDSMLRWRVGARCLSSSFEIYMKYGSENGKCFEGDRGLRVGACVDSVSARAVSYRDPPAARLRRLLQRVLGLEAVAVFIAPVVRVGPVLLIVSVLGLNGCATVGPQSVTAGRSAYTEVINRTENEQILNVLVRMRYDETFGMISVASITANLRFSARAGAQIGVGDDANFAGNLVPLSAGVGYEENPTISYVPLSGEDFTRRMIAPVSTREWILLEGLVDGAGSVLHLGLDRINGLRNPAQGVRPPSQKFSRFVELYEQLRADDVLDVVQIPSNGNKDSFFWDVHDYKLAHDDSVREFLDLLDIEASMDGPDILLPLREAPGRSSSAIHVQPRSAYAVLRLMGNGIHVPSAHLDAGIVEPLTSEVRDDLRFIIIRSSETRPDNAVVEIQFRGWWFFIDATDTHSKRAFTFLRTFIGMRLADAAATQLAPVLTVPVN